MRERSSLFTNLGELVRQLLSSRVGDYDRYRLAVEMAWADKDLNVAEKDLLSILEKHLGLSRAQAEELEVMGGHREELVSLGREHKDRTEDPLDNERWVGLVEELVGTEGLFDELYRNMRAFDPSQQELADHVMLRLEEVLKRSGVEVFQTRRPSTADDTRPRKLASRWLPVPRFTETFSPGSAVGPRY